MAIQNRRGNKANFDPNKLLAGEFAFSLDTEELFYCVSPGNVKRCATKEDIQDILNSSQDAYDRLMELVDTLEDDPALSTRILTDIANLKTNKLDKTGDTKDNVTTFTEAAAETNIASGEKNSVIFGKILKSIKTFRTSIGTLTSLTTSIKTSLVAAINELVSSKINKTDIINNDTTGGIDKPSSAEVAKIHGQEIDGLVASVAGLNNNLNGVRFVRGQTGTVVTSTNAFNIPLETGRYAIELVTGTGMGNAVASYLVYRSSAATSLTPVIEGTHNLAPRCSAIENGIAILLRAGEEARNVYYCIKIF